MDRHLQMRVLHAVAHAPSLAAASRRLGVCEATVTRAMAALERRLGTRLLTRSTRGVTLTDVGVTFAAECARLLQAVGAAEASANGLHSEPRGQLRLVMPLLFGDQLLMPIVLDYLDVWPAIDMSVIYQDRFPNLHEEGVDVAVLIGALADSSMVARKVGTVRQVVCASPGYLATRGEPMHPHELAGHASIYANADGGLMEWRFQQQNVVFSVALKPVLRCTTASSAIIAACRGAGLACCWSYQAHDSIQDGRLTRLLSAFELPAVPVHVVYREGRRASARVRSFVDYAVERLRRHPAMSGV
ncbi:MAG TPA: LysR family transcriptional regulator [Pseudomonas sp.]|uniref:LysR family transcriptional regulator n=1 Tax=Pseudomonas sp. TaxID=306 RepID=UPI002EDA290E